MMKMSVKTLLKLGAAVAVGAAVFIGSTVMDKGSKKEKSGNNQSNAHHGQQGGLPEKQENSNKGSEGLRDVQNVMMKTSQFITTMITICDAIGRLFSIEPVPRYTGSTIII